MFNNYPEILTPEMASKILVTSRKTMMKRLKEGEIRSFKDGKSYRILREDLEAYIYKKRSDGLNPAPARPAPPTVDAPKKHGRPQRAKKASKGSEIS
jgi:excisionase family DNA binding protein